MPWSLKMEEWRLKSRRGGSKWRPGAWKVCGKIVADSDHIDEEQDPDPIILREENGTK